MADSVVLLRWATQVTVLFDAEIFLSQSLFQCLCLCGCRTRPVITVDVSIFLPASINISVPQCHEGHQNLNCFNITVCMRFRGKQLPGQIGENTTWQGEKHKKLSGHPERATKLPMTRLLSSTETWLKVLKTQITFQFFDAKKFFFLLFTFLPKFTCTELESRGRIHFWTGPWFRN